MTPLKKVKFIKTIQLIILLQVFVLYELSFKQYKS